MREAVIVEAVRTPVGRHGGALAKVRPDDMAALVIKEVVGMVAMVLLAVFRHWASGRASELPS